MGGKTVFRIKNKDVLADSIELARENYGVVLQEIYGILHEINHHLNFMDNKYPFTSYLNGSSRWMLEDIRNIKVKNTLNDLDVMIPREKAKELWALLESGKIQNYICCNRINPEFIGNTLICLFRVNGKKLQVDFELAGFENRLPTEWARFSHSSSLEDAKEGIKGVFHKFMLRALVGSKSELDDVVICTPSSTQDKIRVRKDQSAREYSWGVEKGLCRNYTNLKESYFRELKPQEKIYSTDLQELANFIFEGKQYSLECIQDATSITRNLYLLEPQEIHDFMTRFMEILFGSGEQKLELDKEIDFQNKIMVVSYIIEHNKILSNYLIIWDSKIKAYYDLW